ncbi:MAG TPA: rhomboid family intramembrane serine protease [Acidimicrobiia bacterium]|nr:rhomboid family intramembrane serine protease [Acidimicrobiia bacterium]
MTQDHATAAPVCYRHPDRSTLLSCSRCGRPICSSCSVDAAVGQRCPDCLREEGAQRVVPTGPRRRQSALAGAPATAVFIGLAVVFFLLRFTDLQDDVFQMFAQSNAAIEDGEWWRIFTVVLLHGSLTHIIFNMWALYVLGPQIERGVGTWPFVTLFLAAAGVGGAFAYFLGNPGDVAVGASGAIFGLFGIWLSWAVHRRNTAYGRALLGQLAFLLVINAGIAFVFPTISWQAHLGGLIAGFVIGEIWSRIQGPNADAMRAWVGLAVAVLAALSVAV